MLASMLVVVMAPCLVAMSVVVLVLLKVPQLVEMLVFVLVVGRALQ